MSTAEADDAKNAERIEHAYSTTIAVSLVRRMVKMITKTKFPYVKSNIVGVVKTKKFDYVKACNAARKYKFALGGLKT